MTTEAQIQANRANEQKSTGPRVRSDRVSGIGVTRCDACPFGPCPLSFCAKQTQFGPWQSKGQVVCRKGVMVERTCKEHWKNKPNFWRDRAGRGPRGVGRGGNCATSPRCPASGNKPNSVSRNEPAGGEGQRAIVQNKAKFGEAGGSGRWRIGERIVRSKANLRGREPGAKCFQNNGLGEKVSGLWR